MREMKDSGIEWIGVIPVEWRTNRVKDCYKVITGNGFPLDLQGNLSGDYPVYKASDISFSNKIAVSSTNYLTSETVQRNHFNIIPKGSVLHPKIGEALKKNSRVLCGVDCCVDNNCQGIVPINNNSDYSYYLFLCIDMQWFDNAGTIPCVNNQKLKDFKVPCPLLSEQHRIAAYLDTKCAEIDSLTADIQTQIETLEQYKRSVITETVTKGLNPDVEMKDSGVFYMAPMNATWRLTKLGYICTKLSRLFVPEDTALICSNKGKVQVRADDLTGIMVSDDNAMQGIRSGDIAIHGMDTWHGAIALSQHDGKITRVVHVCDSTEDKRFIVYYMQHLAFQGVYKLISNGVRENTSDFRSWDKVRDICIAIPTTKQEQAAICDYLDRQCNAVDEVVAIKKEQLEILSEYKKSLIFEYVTGKKEVPNA